MITENIEEPKTKATPKEEASNTAAIADTTIVTITTFTNATYAVAIMVFLKPDSELAFMIEVMVKELAKLVLHLNKKKTKLMTNKDVQFPRSGDPAPAPHPDCTSARSRGSCNSHTDR